MNGRVYDPQIGRFISADPIVQAPFYSQSLNRYSYVWNNPLTFVDPSGFVTDAWECHADPFGNAICTNTGWINGAGDRDSSDDGPDAGGPIASGAGGRAHSAGNAANSNDNYQAIDWETCAGLNCEYGYGYGTGYFRKGTYLGSIPLDAWQIAMLRALGAADGSATKWDIGNGDLQHVIRAVALFFENHGEVNFGFTAAFGTGVKVDASLSRNQATFYFGTAKGKGLAADAALGLSFGNAPEGLTTFGFVQGGSGLGGYFNAGGSQAGPFTSFGFTFGAGRAYGVTTGYTISASYEDIWHAVNSMP